MDITRREALIQSAGLLTLTELASAEAPAAKRKLLIAGAHPDDPESACGGLIALCAKAGHDVVNLYLTRGEAGIHGKSHEEAAKIRTAEAEAACHLLGARPLFAGQIDGATEVNAARYDELRALLEKEQPQVVVTHWPIDTHRDHRAVSLLVYDAWLRLNKPFELYYFEVEMGAQTQQFRPTEYVDITAAEEIKRKACYAHESQNAKDGFYELHHAMHRFRGQESGVEFAEAYVRHRFLGNGIF